MIRNIAQIAQNPDNCQEVYECNAVLALLSSVPYLDGVVLDEVARAFAHLARHPACARQLVANDGIPMLLDVLNKGDQVAQEHAVLALSYIRADVRGAADDPEVQQRGAIAGASGRPDAIWCSRCGCPL